MLSYDSLNSKDAPSGTPKASNRRCCSTFLRPFVSRPRWASAALKSFTGIFNTSIGCVGSGFLSLSGTISGFGARVPSLSVMAPRTGVAVSTAIFRGFAENLGFARRPRRRDTPKLPPFNDGVAGVAGAGGGACAGGSGVVRRLAFSSTRPAARRRLAARRLRAGVAPRRRSRHPTPSRRHRRTRDAATDGRRVAGLPVGPRAFTINGHGIGPLRDIVALVVQMST